jgi:hypothetical protein
VKAPHPMACLLFSLAASTLFFRSTDRIPRRFFQTIDVVLKSFGLFFKLNLRSLNSVETSRPTLQRLQEGYQGPCRSDNSRPWRPHSQIRSYISKLTRSVYRSEVWSTFRTSEPTAGACSTRCVYSVQVIRRVCSLGC